MSHPLHDTIEAMNFTDVQSVKNTLHMICDHFADAAEVDREKPPEPMLDLWHRCDNLNVHDHNQVKMLLKDLVSAINAFHPAGREAVAVNAEEEGKPQ